MKRFSLFILMSFLFSSCSILPLGTDIWINRKLDNAALGSSKQQVLESFGNPIYRIKFLQASNVEIWGYDLGHYWYHESVTLFFKDDRFIGVPRTPYDLMAFMHQLKLMDPDAEFLSGHPAKA